MNFLAPLTFLGFELTTHSTKIGDLVQERMTLKRVWLRHLGCHGYGIWVAMVTAFGLPWLWHLGCCHDGLVTGVGSCITPVEM